MSFDQVGNLGSDFPLQLGYDWVDTRVT